MAEPLKESTQAKVRDLVGQITVAHDLDPEIQEELFGHIEDKLLEYMSREEVGTEEEALVLAREQFGSIEVVQTMLRGVHVEAAYGGLLRRAMAFVLVSISINTLPHLLLLTLTPFFLISEGSFPLNYALSGVQFTNSMYLLLSPILLFLILRRWKNRGGDANSSWFYRMSLRRMAGWILALGLVKLLPILPVEITVWNHLIRIVTSSDEYILYPTFVSPVLYSALWLWWMNTRNWRLQWVAGSCALWAVYWIGGMFVPSRSFLIPSSTEVSFYNPLISGTFLGNDMDLYIFYPWLHSEIVQMLGMFGLLTALAFVWLFACYAVMWVATYRRRATSQA